MHDTLSERRTFARGEDERDDPCGAAAEVAALLARAGVDHASVLWFQLLELATQEACDWSERSAAADAPLSPRTAARLGLRALAGKLLSSGPADAQGAQAAAEACLAVCAEIDADAHAPERARRWGEGALPRAPERRSLLPPSGGCC